MQRVKIEVEVERNLVERAELAQLDLTAEVERALRRTLLIDPTATDRLREDLKVEAEWYNDHSDRHGLFADRWRRF